MARLKKADVERLAREFDSDPTGALLTALRVVTDTHDLDWITAVNRLPFDEVRRGRLATRDTAAMDELLRDLIELRDLAHPSGEAVVD